MTGTSGKHEFYGSEQQKIQAEIWGAAPTGWPRLPRARFTNIDDTGHMVVGDRNDQLGQAIVEFLKSLHGEKHVGLDNTK